MTTSTKFCLCFIYLTVLFSNAAISTSSDSAEDRVQVSLKNLVRNRRQVCPDGIYPHEGRNCCLCAAGQRVKDHCTSNPNDRTCEHCESKKTYSDQPNSEQFCKLCTSCDHPNANLETEEECTIGRDAKCRCKPNHFCSSNSTGTCIICQPCETCASSGNKELCARYCKEETNNVGAIVGGIIGTVAVVAAVVVGVICCKMRSKKSSADISPEKTLLTVPDYVKMERLLPDIATRLRWKDMKNIALRSGISQTEIYNVKLGHPQDPEEMTLDLLGKWVERMGKHASQELIEMLQKSGKNDTAEKILEIYNSANPVTSNRSE